MGTVALEMVMAAERLITMAAEDVVVVLMEIGRAATVMVIGDGNGDGDDNGDGDGSGDWEWQS